MDVWRITVAALRRWYVLLPLLALTGLATTTVGDSIRPQYEVTATAILVPGTTESEIANPYGNMEQTNTALSIVLNNTESRERMTELGLNPDYQITTRSRSTIMDFSVQSATPELGVETGQAVFELAREQLAERQGAVGIAASSQVGVQILQPPSVSDVVAEGKLRNMAIVGILGAALSLLVAVLFDDLVGLIRRSVRRRRERRAAKRGAAAEHRTDSEESAEPADSSTPEDVPRPDGAVREATDESTQERGRDLARATRDG